MWLNNEEIEKLDVLLEFVETGIPLIDLTTMRVIRIETDTATSRGISGLCQDDRVEFWFYQENPNWSKLKIHHLECNNCDNHLVLYIAAAVAIIQMLVIKGIRQRQYLVEKLQGI